MGTLLHMSYEKKVYRHMTKMVSWLVKGKALFSAVMIKHVCLVFINVMANRIAMMDRMKLNAFLIVICQRSRIFWMYLSVTFIVHDPGVSAANSTSSAFMEDVSALF